MANDIISMDLYWRKEEKSELNKSLCVELLKYTKLGKYTKTFIWVSGTGCNSHGAYQILIS